jgi:D-sedoheptulose 7-phosphate isomerase
MTVAEDPNLAGLYPFLHGKKQDPLSMNSALLESVQQKSAHHHQVIDTFFARNGQQVVAAAGAIADV